MQIRRMPFRTPISAFLPQCIDGRRGRRHRFKSYFNYLKKAWPHCFQLHIIRYKGLYVTTGMRMTFDFLFSAVWKRLVWHILFKHLHSSFHFSSLVSLPIEKSRFFKTIHDLESVSMALKCKCRSEHAALLSTVPLYGGHIPTVICGKHQVPSTNLCRDTSTIPTQPMRKNPGNLASSHSCCTAA